jgi:hypothetical protein
MFGGPDIYFAVQVVPEGVERLKALNRRVAAQRGIEIVFCGEGYSRRQETMRSAYRQAEAKAVKIADEINEDLEGEIFAAIVTAGYHPSPNGQSGRATILRRVREQHPDAEIVVVRDEFTGVRFARAKRNRGRCEKLGHNSSTPRGNGSNCYQVWARW